MVVPMSSHIGGEEIEFIEPQPGKISKLGQNIKWVRAEVPSWLTPLLAPRVCLSSSSQRHPF